MSSRHLLLRLEVLERENERLRALLLRYGISCNEVEGEAKRADVFLMPEISAWHARMFYSYFKGRKDVYAKRNITRDGKGVYYPVCDNFWVDGKCPRRDGVKIRCFECSARQWTPLNQRVLMRHLQGKDEEGRDVVGVYPLMEDGTCHFLVFDFDCHDDDSEIDWRSEVDSLRELCKYLSLDVLVERSRSGKGAHVWLFFDTAVSAAEARRFGACLLTRGAELVDQKTFLAYDRMLPAQDKVPDGGLGNLIALPLQGQAIKNGNSVFVDEVWNPYADQWRCLQEIKRVSSVYMRDKIREWGAHGEMGVVSCLENIEEFQPWRKADFMLHRVDVEGSMRVVDSCMLYIRTDNLKARICNTLRRLASFSKPLFYRNRAMGISTKGVLRIIPCYDEDGIYIGIPRGKREQFLELCEENGISLNYKDLRNRGRSINVTFSARLYPEQQSAADAMLKYEHGILQAATAFGKTAVGAYLIAARKVNTLILVHNREIMKNWVDDLQKFLTIDEFFLNMRLLRGGAGGVKAT